MVKKKKTSRPLAPTPKAERLVEAAIDAARPAATKPAAPKDEPGPSAKILAVQKPAPQPLPAAPKSKKLKPGSQGVVAAPPQPEAQTPPTVATQAAIAVKRLASETRAKPSAQRNAVRKVPAEGAPTSAPRKVFQDVAEAVPTPDPQTPAPASSQAADQAKLDTRSTLSEPFEDFAAEAQRMMRASFDETTSLLGKLRGATNPAEIVLLQTNYLQHSLRLYTAFAQHFGKLMAVSQTTMMKQGQATIESLGSIAKKPS